MLPSIASTGVSNVKGLEGVEQNALTEPSSRPDEGSVLTDARRRPTWVDSPPVKVTVNGVRRLIAGHRAAGQSGEVSFTSRGATTVFPANAGTSAPAAETVSRSPPSHSGCWTSLTHERTLGEHVMSPP